MFAASLSMLAGQLSEGFPIVMCAMNSPRGMVLWSRTLLRYLFLSSTARSLPTPRQLSSATFEWPSSPVTAPSVPGLDE